MTVNKGTDKQKEGKEIIKGGSKTDRHKYFTSK
jgi:hypothetical protein